MNSATYDPLFSGNLDDDQGLFEFGLDLEEARGTKDDVGNVPLIEPSDSISNVGAPRFAPKMKSYESHSVVSGASNWSAASRAKVEAAASHAELKVKAEVLRKKHELESEIQLLQRRKEQLELEAEVAAASARLEAIQQVEASQYQGQGQVQRQLASETSQRQPGYIPPSSVAHERTTQRADNVQGENQPVFDLSAYLMQQTNVIQRQNDLTKVLVECHQRASLPQRTLLPFNGDPLQYNSFMRAFQHSVEEKTSNPRDKLCYLEQFTRGEANTMVRSCMYNADPEIAYKQAKEVLQKNYGNKYRITNAIIKRMEEWPEIKTDDAEKLNNFSHCLTELLNTAKDLKQCNEIDHSNNVKIAISKLPYRLREKWRHTADYIQEEKGKCIQFEDVVTFVAKAARVISNPVYGDIKGPQRRSDTTHSNVSQPGKRNERQGFATSISSQRSSSDKYCLYCRVSTHDLETCRNLGAKPHEERIEFCRSQGLCFSCLKKASHFAKECKSRLKCTLCQRTHPSVLHRQFQKGTSIPNQDGVPKSQKEVPVHKDTVHEDTDATSTNSGTPATDKSENGVKRTLSSFSSGSGSLPVAIPVVVRSRESGKQIQTYAFLDNGSNAVFVSQDMKDRLQLSGKRKNIQLQTLTQSKAVNCEVINDIEVLDLKQENNLQIREAFVQQSIPVGKEEVPTQAKLTQFPYLHHIQLPEIDEDVGILIGNNIPKASEPLEVIHSEHDGPFAFRTLLGWAVCGLSKSDESQRISAHHVSVQADINQQLVDMFNQDFSERVINDKPEKSRQDRQFIDSVEGSIQHVDGHYEIGLPLKSQSMKMPNNKPQAEQRLAHLQRKFMRQPQFHREYKDFMHKVIDKNYAEMVPDKELQKKNGEVWYIPHHGVYHPQKRKLRVVYDCAAAYRGQSLNQNLLQGPDLTNSLLGVLTRFRQDHIAVMADIEAMFSQVRLRKEDKDLHRFLWWPDGNIERPIKEYRMNVHVFGATSSPACANYALKQTAEQCEHDEVAHIIQHDFYVDDCLYSSSTVEKAVELSKGLQATCGRGGFHLTKWNSNHRAVLHAIPKDERASSVQQLNFEKDKLPQERALGILWNAETDSFGYSIKIKDRPPTKRGMLSIISSVYDPLGFVSPVILTAKQLLQDLCRLKIGWDDEIPAKQMKLWQGWLEELPMLSEYKIERCLRPASYEQAESISLHHFADASEVGYGTVSYLRMENSEGETRCSFLLSKSRVAPLKQVSIPRMELTAASVAVKIDQVIKRELEIPVKRTYFWTDSQTVLRYIHNSTARFQTFVANRLAVIQDGSSPDQWHYVKSSLNPADAGSRGLKVQELLLNEEWKSGPEFLLKSEEEWPKTPDMSRDGKDEQLEIKKTCMVGLTRPGGEVSTVHKLITYFSDWTRLRRAVAWWLRLKGKLKERAKLSSDKVCSDTLTVAEVNGAELAIVRWVQSESFQEEVEAMNQKGNQPGKAIRKSSSIIKLDPEMHDNVLRVGGRLRNAEIDGNAKHQVILPKKHHVSTLIVRHVHQSVAHQGQNHVLAELLQKYWIIGAGVLTKTIIRKCVTCRRYQAKTNTQKMADLPRPRVAACEPPFTYTGMDYFGPFETRRGRSMQKRYGVVFTCMTSRAIHIEVASSLDTSSAIDAIRRFVSRRGSVKTMYSDNGTNLVGACSALKQALQEWSQEQIMNFCCNRGIQWNFNPPAASHFGGVWERQIRTIRKILHAILHEQYLKTAQSDEQLHTLMCEIEAVINSRPLTRASNDPSDLDVITPNHLLQAKMTTSPPPGRFSEKDVYSKKRWRQMQLLADTFWRRWVREYLPTLQQRQKWAQPNRSLQVGDVVLIADKDAPRCSWQMGRVEEVYPGKDGLVRSARIKTKSTTLTRPVIKLCSLLEAE
ncbi:uncharacterized protein LOC100890015 [Strongylocentrotus purpuratus]|uniref:Integrase catalytic domain-containing protein n=1 Tax=Strongylocentrotus purpuratus TaxID=7668 RepID=A0A7M7GHJ9_STRPU|nr:uncharacterized protein LOC100890015 [Strongylocentrotus purpuratus]